MRRPRPLAVSAVLVSLLVACSGAQRRALRPLALAEADYSIELSAGAGHAVPVELELRFPAAPEVLRLGFTPRYAFVSPHAPLLRAAPVFSGPAGRLEGVRAVDPFTWELRRPPRRLIVRYEVLLDHRELPGVAGRDEYEQPYLEADHGLLSTAVLLLLPQLEPMRCRVRLALPPGWQQRSSWPAEGPWLVAPSALAARNDLLPVGAWEEDRFEAGGFRGAVLYAPGQRARLAAHAGVLEEVSACLIDWMGEPPAPAFAFLFPRTEGRGAGGSPKATAMTLFLGDEVLPHGREFLAHLGAHEFFHLWGRKDLPSPPELRWFEEGVTDWMAYQACQAAGGITAEMDQVALERARATVAAVAGEGLSLAEAGGPAFFEGGAAYSLCYSGGMLVGAWMDRTLADAGVGGLVSFLRAWKGAGGRATRARAPSLEELVAAFGDRAGAEQAAALRRLAVEPFGTEQADACLGRAAAAER